MVSPFQLILKGIQENPVCCAGAPPKPLPNPMSIATQAYLRMATRSARSFSGENLADISAPLTSHLCGAHLQLLRCAHDALQSTAYAPHSSARSCSLQKLARNKRSHVPNIPPVHQQPATTKQ